METLERGWAFGHLPYRASFQRQWMGCRYKVQLGNSPTAGKFFNPSMTVGSITVFHNGLHFMPIFNLFIFIVAVLMLKCLGKHSYLSNLFKYANPILNTVLGFKATGSRLCMWLWTLSNEWAGLCKGLSNESQVCASLTTATLDLGQFNF